MDKVRVYNIHLHEYDLNRPIVGCCSGVTTFSYFCHPHKVDGMPNSAHIYFRIFKEFVVYFIFLNAFSLEIREEFCSASIILNSD